MRALPFFRRRVVEQKSAVGRCLRALAVLVLVTHCGGSAETETSVPERPSFSQASAVVPAATATYTFTPISDARVEGALPARNLGIESTWSVDLSPAEERHDPAFDVALQPEGAVVLGTTLRGELELDGQTFVPGGTSDLLYLRVVR